MLWTFEIFLDDGIQVFERASGPGLQKNKLHRISFLIFLINFIVFNLEPPKNTSMTVKDYLNLSYILYAIGFFISTLAGYKQRALRRNVKALNKGSLRGLG